MVCIGSYSRDAKTRIQQHDWSAVNDILTFYQEKGCIFGKNYELINDYFPGMYGV